MRMMREAMTKELGLIAAENGHSPRFGEPHPFQLPLANHVWFKQCLSGGGITRKGTSRYTILASRRVDLSKQDLTPTLSLNVGVRVDEGKCPR